MKRASAVLSILALLACLLAAACGGNAAAQQSGSPTVSVRAATDTEFGDSEVWTLTLAPTGRPSGIIALVTVRDGKVDTLESVPFHDITGGSASVLVTPHGIEAAVSTSRGGVTSGNGSGPFAFPKGSTAEATAWGGAETGSSQAIVLWTQDRFVAPRPSAGPQETGGALADVVTASKAQPRVTSYCLTLKVVAK